MCNRLRIAEKAKRKLDDAGIEPKPIAPEILIPMLEVCGNIESQTLSDMFASLLAASLNPDEHEKVHPSFAQMLSELSPFDAAIFSRLMSSTEQIRFESSADELSILHLARLGLVTRDIDSMEMPHLATLLTKAGYYYQPYQATKLAEALWQVIN